MRSQLSIRIFHLMILFVLLFPTRQAEAKTFIEPSVFEKLKDRSTVEVILVFPANRPLSGRTNVPKNLVLQSAKNANQMIIGKLSSHFAWFSSRNFIPLWLLNGVILPVSSSELAELSKLKSIQAIYDGDKKFTYSEPESRSYDFSIARTQYTNGIEKIGLVELLKERPDLDGKGVRVGVIDTGIDPRHPDLKGKTIQYRDFTPNPKPEPGDGFGHGTHVAGTVAGGANSGKQIGVAPAADLVIARIFDRNGASTRSLILQAMQWMADPDEDPTTDDAAQVVNGSWSDDEPFNDRIPEDEPFCQIIDRWIEIGIVPVFSAGNTGPAEASVNIPGGCPNAVAVGATEANDRLMYFSGTGPANWLGASYQKPDIVAPGFRIYSARSGGGYERMSGTSMSTPHVTGAFAILRQAFPDSSVHSLVEAMKQSAKDLGDTGADYDFGWGRIDLVRAYESLDSQQ